MYNILYAYFFLRNIFVFSMTQKYLNHYWIANKFLEIGYNQFAKNCLELQEINDLHKVNLPVAFRQFLHWMKCIVNACSEGEPSSSINNELNSSIRQNKRNILHPYHHSKWKGDKTLQTALQAFWCRDVMAQKNLPLYLHNLNGNKN